MAPPPRLDPLARSLTRQVVDRSRPFVLGVGGESPLSDGLSAEGVTTLAVAPIYLRRGDANDASLTNPSVDGIRRPAPIMAGALAVMVGAHGRWSDERTALIQRVGDIFAHRIQADEFVAVQQQRRRELTGLAEVARTMQSGADEERLYHGFAGALRRLLRFEALCIARVDDTGWLGEIPSFGPSGRATPFPAFTGDDVTHPWFSLRSPELWTRGAEQAPGFLSDDSRYAVIVPMRPKGQMLGLTIVVVPRPVRGDQLPIVEQAVEQLALALDGATLYQQAMARASHIQALSNLAKIVASVVKLREAFSAFSEEVRWLIPFDRAVMFLVDEEQQSVEPYAMYSDGALTPDPTSLRDSLASVAIAAGTAVAFRRDDPRYKLMDWTAAGEDVEEIAAVPIQHGGRTSAVFALVTNSAESYAIGDLDALDEVAGLLAVTIDRIRLFEQADYGAKHDLLTELPLPA